MSKTVLLCDLDGFVARFTNGVYAAHGRKMEAQPTEWNFHHGWGMKDEELYAKCDRPFWAGLDVWEDGMALVSMAEFAVGRNHICFVSSPTRTPGTGQGKREWFAEHFPKYDPWADLFVGGAKWKLAGPGKILLDDSGANCEAFDGAGGRSLLIPRPWNLCANDCVPGTDGLFDVDLLYDNLMRMLA